MTINMGMDRQKKKKSWIQRNKWKISIGTVLFGAIFYQIIFADHSSKLNVEVDKITIGEVKQDLFQDFSF